MKRRNNLNNSKTEHSKILKKYLRENASENNRKIPKIVALINVNIIFNTEKNYFTKKLNEQNELRQPQNKPKNDIKNKKFQII